MTAARRLILATRRSALALAQSRAFARSVMERWPDVEVEELHVTTTGDRITDVPLADVGGKGLFTKEIEQALLEHRADFAVHSLKDVPAVLAPEFCLACIPKRADARDVLIPRQTMPTATLSSLPERARIGTSSLRRSIQLTSVRPDLVLVPFRGNVDTRLRKLNAGEVDAIVLARAGLLRLALDNRPLEILPPEMMLPAPGQGALAVECRADDEATRQLLAVLADTDSGIAVSCERGVMSAIGADCKVPFGAHACRIGTDISVDALFAPAERQGQLVRASRIAPWPDSIEAAHWLGMELGTELLSK